MRPYDRREGSKKPMIAGVLLIIACLLAFVGAGQIFFFDLDALDIEGILEDEDVDGEIDTGLVETVLNVCGAIFLVIGIFLLVGGVFAIKRMNWGIALVASIVGLFSIGPFFLGSILSLVALVLIYMSKDEFKGKGKDEYFEEQPPVQQPGPGQVSQEARYCTDCGDPMQYDEGYERWYCATCHEYK